MSAAIREYDVVRVRSLDGIGADRCGLGCRAPAVGDMGAVIAILSAVDREDASLENTASEDTAYEDTDSEDKYLVECVQADATSAWIASFPLRSLEVVSPIEEVS